MNVLEALYGAAIVIAIGAMAFTSGIKYERRRMARSIRRMVAEVSDGIDGMRATHQELHRPADTDGGGRDE